jgi:hypothetical protein
MPAKGATCVIVAAYPNYIYAAGQFALNKGANIFNKITVDTFLANLHYGSTDANADPKKRRAINEVNPLIGCSQRAW